MSRSPRNAKEAALVSFGTVCEATGLVLAIYLELADRYGVPVRCLGFDGCRRMAGALPSPLSDLPIPLIGIVGFSVLIALRIAANLTARSEPLRRLHFYAAASGTLASVSLTALGYVNARALCPWCLGILLCIGGTAAVSGVQLKRKAPPSVSAAYASVVSASLAATAGVFLYFGVSVATLENQIPPAKLRQFPLRLAAGDVFAGRHGQARSPAFVAFYVPGCGGCVQSMAYITGPSGLKDLAKLQPRLLCERDSREFESVELMQAVINRGDDLTTRRALEFFTEHRTPPSTEAVSAFLRRNRVAPPTPEELREAERYLTQSRQLLGKLEIRGFPVVLRYPNDHDGYEVNPLTFGFSQAG